MDRLIDVASVVIFISMIMYAAIKLDEAAKKLRDEEERIYEERKLKWEEVFNDYIYNDIICFYVGRLTRPEPKADIDNIIEDLANEESYIYGVYYDGFLEDVTEEQKKDLEKEINKVIQNWLDKYDLRDYGFLIKNMEMVRVWKR